VNINLDIDLKPTPNDPSRGKWRKIDSGEDSLSVFVYSSDNSERLVQDIRDILPSGDMVVRDMLAIDSRHRLWDKLTGQCSFARTSLVVVDRRLRRFFAKVGDLSPARIYLREQPGGILLSTALAQTAKAGDAGGLDRAAIWYCINNGYVPSPETVFVGVFKLPVGMPFEYSERDHSISGLRACIEKSYFRHMNEKLEAYRSTVDNYGDWDNSRVENILWDFLQDQLKGRIPRKDEIILLLSGGIDSILLFESARFAIKGQNRLSAVNFDFASEGSTADAIGAAGLCEKYGVPIHMVRADTMELVRASWEVAKRTREPVGNMSALPILLLLEECKGVDGTVVSGDGAEGVFRAMRTLDMLDSISDSSAFRLREVMKRYVRPPTMRRDLVRAIGFARATRFIGIFSNPELCFIEGKYGGSGIIGDQAINFEWDQEIMSARWLLGFELEQLPDAIAIFFLYHLMRDKENQKLTDLAEGLGLRAFCPYNTDEAYDTLAPIFRVINRREGGKRATGKMFARRIIDRFEDGRYVASRKLGLAPTTRDVRRRMIESISSPSSVESLLINSGLTDSKSAAKAITGALTDKQAYSARAVAKWLKFHHQAV